MSDPYEGNMEAQLLNYILAALERIEAMLEARLPPEPDPEDRR